MPIGYATKYKDILWLTDRRMVYLTYNEIFGGYQVAEILILTTLIKHRKSKYFNGYAVT